MTRKEAKEAVKEAYGNSEYTDEIIQALEQEPIIDKIRAKIEFEEKWLSQAGYNAYNVDIALNAIKQVISESEEK